ncbi:hypothetical protein ACHAQA_009526 [Verticillium albo-atrum]
MGSTAATGASADSSLLDDFPLDMLGQQPLLKIYTQLCSCYPMPDDSEASRAKIIATLTKGLERLAAAFPWVAGTIATVKNSDSGTEDLYIKPHERIPLLVQKDLRDDPDAPTWAALEDARFPINLLDESLFAPIATFPIPTGDPVQDAIVPVFAVQATFLRGGLVLCFAAHHGTMDMNSEGLLISYLARACASDSDSDAIFTPDELAAGNLRRPDAVALLTDEEYAAVDPALLAQQIIPAVRSPAAKEEKEEVVESQSDAATPPAKCVWANFDFDAEALRTLKAEATRTLHGAADFISTDDALTAFTWAAVTRARLPRLRAAGITTSGFARAVDARPHLPVSNAYLGLLSNMTYHAWALDALAPPARLGAVAADLRAAVAPTTSTIGLRSRALATFMHRAPENRSAVSYTARLDLSAGIMLSSWARIDAYDLAFGMGLGPPASVRRPRFALVESLAYLLPRTREGAVGLAICLREEEVEALRGDEEWARLARFVG